MKPPTIALSKTMTLAQLQAYVQQICVERGFNLENAEQKMLMLTEEVGELARALRKSSGLKFATDTHRAEVSDELADVLIVLLGLANIVEVPMPQAVMAKETRNRKRTWK